MSHRIPRNCVVFTVAACICTATALAEPASWPGLRGPDQDGTVNGRLIDGDTAGLTVGWTRALGSGYSSVVVGDGKVVTMFAAGEDDVLAAFDTETGEELWRYRIGETYAGHSGSHDGPISTPLFAGDRIFGLGAHGHLFAVDAASGKAVWTKHVVDDMGGKAPFYGFTSSPIMVSGVLVVEIGAPDGKAIVGLDPDTGEVKWAVGDDGIEYQSPIAATIGDRRQVLAVGNDKLFGIDPVTGEELWSYEHGGDARAMGGRSMVPVPAGEGRFFLMNRQESSTMVKIASTKELKYDVSVLWSDKSISRSYVPPVYHEGYLYGISGRILTCIDAATGEMQWRSREPGDGFLTMVGNKLVVMTKSGRLHLATVSPDGYHEMARLDLFDEHSWSEVAIVDGHLFARSMGHLARIEVSSTGGVAEATNAWLSKTDFGAFLAGLDHVENKTATIDAFMKEQHSFPIIEGSDVVHFVYRGEAEDMGIVGDMIGFRREDPMHKVVGTDLYYYSMRLEPEAAVSYGFIKDYGEPTPDPLNPNPADGLFGEVSWLAMPAWQAPEFIAAAPASRQGRMETVEWEREVPSKEEGEEKTVKEKRTAQVYLPAGFDPDADRRYPTVYIHNGKGALDNGSMKHSLDNLIGESVEPLIAVFLMPREGQDGDDIGRTDAHTEMVIKELVPLIDARYPTVQDARRRASVGVAGGGAVALASAIQHPDVFGLVGSQSATLFGVSVSRLLSSAEELPPLVIYMDWGTYDMRSPHEAWDMADDNREAWAAFREAGYRPAGGEVPEGVGWGCWRGHTDEMLVALFPLPDPA